VMSSRSSASVMFAVLSVSCFYCDRDVWDWQG
jgi:hypothetical protein